MNWAWRQTLTPTLKLVLMGLADAADDQGVCWPSVSTLARKCTVSTRTVQRSLQILIDGGLLIAEPRQRRDGSSTSNRYRLVMEGDDILSPPHEAGDTRAGQGCRGDPEALVSPGTTNRIVTETPQPAGDKEQPIDLVTVESGGGQCLPLEYPKGLSPSESVDAQKRLSRLPPELAQQLLDELAARLKAGTIRVSPLVYLAGLIKRANAGEFVPEDGLRIADARTNGRLNEAFLQRLQAVNHESMFEKTAFEDSPLAKRLAHIRLRSRGRGKDS